MAKTTKKSKIGPKEAARKAAREKGASTPKKAPKPKAAEDAAFAAEVAKQQAAAKKRAEARALKQQATTAKAPSQKPGIALALPTGNVANIVAALPKGEAAPAKPPKATKAAKEAAPKVKEREAVELPKLAPGKGDGPRPGTSARKMFELACRKEGASVEEINAATGAKDGSWTNTMKRLAARFGRKLEAGGERGNTRYWIV